jgi:hypothetical protein
MTDSGELAAPEGDALSRALVRQRPGLAGHVHYINGQPWCDGINHTTMCSDDFSDEWMAHPAVPAAPLPAELEDIRKPVTG